MISPSFVSRSLAGNPVTATRRWFNPSRACLLDLRKGGEYSVSSPIFPRSTPSIPGIPGLEAPPPLPPPLHSDAYSEIAKDKTKNQRGMRSPLDMGSYEDHRTLEQAIGIVAAHDVTKAPAVSGVKAPGIIPETIEQWLKNPALDLKAEEEERYYKALIRNKYTTTSTVLWRT